MHIVESNVDWGPIWQFSAFVFESYNAKILKYIKAANGVPNQISKKYYLDLHSRLYSKTMFSNNEKARNLYNKLVKVDSKEYQKYEIKSPLKSSILDQNIIELLRVYNRGDKFLCGKSAFINGVIFKTTESNKRANCFIRIEETLL